ncbi:cation channel sperm-associated protein 3-like [Xenia sp. Carnegie-2017]|uniref:cation channel sperm-associated protein 3-like n=1 Tax=Xenia sp. Carnegie-2017 TaxID=2897299 RepID=UPI001F038285|nr:cation channel sperm-associated protein 3-like [Xenia sp. Carnegie-2017]
MAIIKLESREKRKRRFDADFNKYVIVLTNSRMFNAAIMGVIMFNALVIGLETMDFLKNTYKKELQIIDELFLSIYTVEFILKLYSEPTGYWKSSYNRFDFLILFISYIQAVMDSIDVGDNILKPLRLLRAARTLRTISFIQGLQVLVIALIETLRHSVLNVVVLLSMSMAFFAVVGYYMFGHDEKTGVKNENWSSLSAAMLSLFTYVTVDGWTDIQKGLDIRPYSQWFTISFIVLGHFIFTNLFIGIIIMNIHEATETFRLQQVMEKEATLQMKKDFLYQRQHNDVKEMLEKQKSSQFVDFKDMCRAFQETLRPDDFVIMSDTSTNLVWMETFITSLDHLDLYTYRCQQLHFQLTNCLINLLEMERMKTENK